MRRLLPVTLTALAAGVVGQTPIVQTVLANGTTQTRYDMVILAEGYQAAQQAQFDQDVTTFLTALFQTEPYQTFAAYYNVHTVFRASVDAGADQPDVTPPIFVDTAYDATYNTGGVDRCLYIGDTALALADAALAPATEGRVLVLVNSTRYGGCAGTFAVSYNGTLMSSVQTHELGHSLGLLADEYDYPNDTYTGAEPAQANVTISPVGNKWSHWWGSDSISAFEGARYYLHGIWRPRADCLMRSLGQTLCAVCKEQIVEVTNSVVNTIVAATPAGPTTLDVPLQQVFSITHIVPAVNLPLITWKLDGNVVPGATGTSHVLDSTTLALGLHTLEVSVLDRTSMVRADPGATMRETRTWQVTIHDPAAINLRVPSFTANATFVTPGATVTLSPTITNDGPGVASNFAVEFFLSTTPAWSTNDIYLGKTTVATLGPLQSTVAAKQVQLPWRLSAQPWFVTAVVDRAGAFNETHESDNTRSTAVLGVAGPCLTKLEFEDPLLYPATAASVSVATGGALHPIVISTCNNPAVSLYWILWGASGTAPGLQLSPTAFLPLNLDAFTDLGIALTNSPIFDAFLGVFDAQGRAHATFALPPSTSLVSMQTHFACLVATDTTLFAAATNAVTVDLLP